MQPNVCTVQKVKDDMTGSEGERDREKQSQRRQNDFPPEILELIIPALKVGSVTGVSGIFVGSFVGVIRSSTPRLFALASGIQWFTLGTAFWASRGLVLHAWGKEQVAPRDKILASTLAGGFGGMTGGLLRGRKNMVPGSIMFGLFGAAGQVLYNMMDVRNTEAERLDPGSEKRSWLDSKWSPVKVLSDKEYESMLQEKLLRVNAQIALVDENIEALRKQQVVAKNISDSESR